MQTFASHRKQTFRHDYGSDSLALNVAANAKRAKMLAFELAIPEQFLIANRDGELLDSSHPFGDVGEHVARMTHPIARHVSFEKLQQSRHFIRPQLASLDIVFEQCFLTVNIR
jgi:hypothetical protein